jgi:hypothetical protein
MMWHTFHFFLCNLVGDDRKSLVELHCISVDDFSIIPPRNLNSQLPTVINACHRDECESCGGFTSDFPVPVAPTTAINGRDGGCAIFANDLMDRTNRSMHLFIKRNGDGEVPCAENEDSSNRSVRLSYFWQASTLSSNSSQPRPPDSCTSPLDLTSYQYLVLPVARIG